MKYCLVITSVASEKDAKRLARLLLSKKLTACVSIIPCRSLYVWQKEMRDEVEFQLHIKTRAELYPEIETLLIAEHPYELPEIIRVPIEGGCSKYLDWVNAETDGKSK